MLTNEGRRHKAQYYGAFILLAAISGLMTILNLQSNQGAQTIATLAFTVLCLANLVIMRFGGEHAFRICSATLSGGLVFLFVYFIIMGGPDGFSPIWICLLPATGMLFFGMRKGSIFSIVMFLALAFFFWCPAGRELLQYSYSETFLTRFPMLYLAVLLCAALPEYIRATTQQELEHLREKYHYLSSHDYLTSILNRQGLNELHEQVAINGPQTVMMLDIDHFKNINDSYGHDVGDLVLTEVARVIDHQADGTLCRWGGEEFVVWLNGAASPAEKAEKIRHAVEQLVVQIPNTEKTVQVTISIGVAQGTGSTPFDELIALSDERMYSAKQNGRNRVICA